MEGLEAREDAPGLPGEPLRRPLEVEELAARREPLRLVVKVFKRVIHFWILLLGWFLQEMGGQGREGEHLQDWRIRLTTVHSAPAGLLPTTHKIRGMKALGTRIVV